ncbi:MAG: imidazole glycerol phosphate synthase subunit HisH [Pseudomonadota bacterium]
MSSHVAVIDYGMGNLHSVESALLHAGADRVVVTRDAAAIDAADRVVFPGVGAIRDCIAEIKRQRCDELLMTAFREQSKPVLAICVGMQALLDDSEENDGTACLGLLQGSVRHFGAPLVDEAGRRLKVPHMGWNRVDQVGGHPLWKGIDDGSRFYFVHSYYVHAEDRSLVAGSVTYGKQADAALAVDNLFAVQFHPEKSHRAGLQLLSNFLGWDGVC